METNIKILNHPRRNELFAFEQNFDKDSAQEQIWWITLASTLLTVSLTLSLRLLNLPNFKQYFLKSGVYLAPIISTLAAFISAFSCFRIMDYLKERSTFQLPQEFVLDDTVNHVTGCSVWIFISLCLLQTKSILRILQGDYHRTVLTAYELSFNLLCTHFYLNPPSGSQVYIPISIFCLTASLGEISMNSMCPRSMDTSPVILQVYLTLMKIYVFSKWFAYSTSIVILSWLVRELNKLEDNQNVIKNSQYLVGATTLLFSSKPIVNFLVTKYNVEKIKAAKNKMKPKAA